MLDQILDRINSKGWNLYEFGDKEPIDTTVLKGPAEILEKSKQYVLYPIVNDTTNVGQIRSAVSYMQRESIFPIMLAGGSLLAVAIVVVEDNRVKIRGPSDVYFSYRDFYEALITLQPTTKESLS